MADRTEEGATGDAVRPEPQPAPDLEPRPVTETLPPKVADIDTRDVLAPTTSEANAPSDPETCLPAVETQVAEQPDSTTPIDQLPELQQPERSAPEILPVIDVLDLDWQAIEAAAKTPLVVRDLQAIVVGLEALLDKTDGARMLFDADRASLDNQALKLSSPKVPLWIIGDLHGDLLALEAALALIEREASPTDAPAGIIFLGDLFDDEGVPLAVLLRIYALILLAPERICLIAGNHDEALGTTDGRFTSSVDPSDFTDFLNAHLDDEWVVRVGQLAIRLFARVPRALFFPDGLLVAHGGFPLSDLHATLAETDNWNDPQVLSDFVWTRAHPKARKKLPNRYTRGGQFGYEDFAAFCALSGKLGRPITHMVRGHDHIGPRYAVYAGDRSHPILTIVALSRRLPREGNGPYERVPTVARYVEGALPQVYRLHIPESAVQTIYPEHPSPTCEEISS